MTAKPAFSASCAALMLGTLGLAATLYSAPASAADGAAPLQPITALSVPRYMGVWYEVAKFPNEFQKQCVGDTTATFVPATRVVTASNALVVSTRASGPRGVPSALKVRTQDCSRPRMPSGE